MRILHTADWHLGDRLGRIDRTEDLRRAVERIGAYCDQEAVDVLLIAGDIFSELATPEMLRDTIRHLQETFNPFLRGGGTILALTGNHDRENFCQTLRHAMNLASPGTGQPGEQLVPGRFYLAVAPTFIRLPDRAGGDVQFVLMPYPTAARYLSGEPGQRYASLEEKNRSLHVAFANALQAMRNDVRFQRQLPTVLGAHVHVRGSILPTPFRMRDDEDVLLGDADLPADFVYTALGHIHKPQCLAGNPHVRYCGSIERLDLGESNDDKGAVLLDVGAGGLAGTLRTLPLPAAPIYTVTVHAAAADLPELRRRYPQPVQDLVRLDLKWTAGVDNREELLHELDMLFPRWYERTVEESNALSGNLVGGEPAWSRSFDSIVRNYLAEQLAHHPDDVRAAVLARAEQLLGETEA